MDDSAPGDSQSWNNKSSNVNQGTQILCGGHISFGSGISVFKANRHEIARAYQWSGSDDASHRKMMAEFSMIHDAFRHEVDNPYEESCCWAPDELNITSWLSDSSSMLLLVGAPGTGKTVLAKHLVEMLEHQNDAGKHTIYFFCDRKKKDGNKAVVILRSLVYQCMTFAGWLGTKHVKQVYDSRGTVLLNDTFRLGKAFVEMMADPGPEEWYCIIDALDDCEERERKALLDCFATNLNAANEGARKSLRLFITSRPCEGMRAAISKMKNKKIVHFNDSHDPHLNATDIEKYIVDHVRGFEHYPTGKRERTEKDLIARADGNFKWAVTMINLLGKTPHESYSDLVASIPSGIQTMLENVLERAKPESKLLLQLVAVLKRPLSTIELADLINMSKSPFADLCGIGNSDATVRESILCGEEGLRFRNDQIHLFHPSLAAYLAERWTEDETFAIHVKLAEACLIYLASAGATQVPLLGSRKSECRVKYCALIDALPFIEYAAVHWSYHLDSAGPEGLSSLWPLLQKLLGNDNVRDLSFQVHQFWHHEVYVRGQSLFHLLIHHGLTSVVEGVTTRRLGLPFQHSVNVKDESGRTPLWWAVKRKNNPMVKLLLEMKETDVNIQDKDDGMSPLMVAVRYGLTDIFISFFETNSSRIKWNLLDKSGFSCLYWAATCGYYHILALLLQKEDVRANIETICACQTPLVTAAREGYEEVVAVLLDKKADPNAPDTREDRTALSWAAGNGHKKVVERLLHHKATIIERRDSKWGWTPFQWASYQGERDIARTILLEMLSRAGGHRHDHALDLLLEAAKMGQEEALDVLLESAGLEVNDGHKTTQRTALATAAKHGHLRVVQKLASLEGVNLNPRDAEGKTPLILASEHGRLDVVKVLLKNSNVDIKATDREGRGAQEWAQRTSHSEIRHTIEMELRQRFGEPRSHQSNVASRSNSGSGSHGPVK